MNFDEIQSRKKPNTRTVRVLLDPDLQVAYESIARDHRKALRDDEKTNEPDRAPGLQRQLDELRERIEEETVPFVFRALRRKDFKKLIDESEPTPTDEAAGLDFGYEEIAPTLLSLAAVKPTLTLAQAEELIADWDEAIVSSLINAAYLVNKEVRDVPFVSGNYVEIPSSEKSSESPESTESPTPSS